MNCHLKTVTREGSLGSDIEAMLKEEDGHSVIQRKGSPCREVSPCKGPPWCRGTHGKRRGGSVSVAEGALSKSSRAKLFWWKYLGYFRVKDGRTITEKERCSEPKQGRQCFQHQVCPELRAERLTDVVHARTRGQRSLEQCQGFCI